MTNEMKEYIKKLNELHKYQLISIIVHNDYIIEDLIEEKNNLFKRLDDIYEKHPECIFDIFS